MEIILENNNNNEIHIVELFNSFLAEGGEPKVTAFKKYLNAEIDKHVKPLCARSGRSSIPGVADWRSEVKARFSGRGAKWVRVEIDEIMPTINRLYTEKDIDGKDYTNWIKKQGYAWIRFAGPRVAEGIESAAFEVRTRGSKEDHPKQLHYIAIEDLDDKIKPLGGTPHSMKLEEDEVKVVAPTPEVKEEVVPVVEASVSDETEEAVEEEYEDVMGDIEALMAEEDNDDF